jgi:ribonucleoside-triphosphate reductase
MKFHTILAELDVDPDYKKFLKTVPIKVIDEMGMSKIDPFAFSKEYFAGRVADASVAPNANVGRKSPSNFYTEENKPFEALQCFEEILVTGRKLFPNFSLDNLFNGALYLMDKTKYRMPYCLGITMTNLMLFGQPFGGLPSLPPKRLHSFMEQAREYMMLMSQQNAGAVAPTDLPVLMAYYLGNETDKEIENFYQSFVHTMNKEFRIGGDSPFSNVMLSSFGPYKKMFDGYRFPDGRIIDDLRDKIQRINRIIMDFMLKGDPVNKGIPYRFPIHTLQVTKADAHTEEFEMFASKNKNGNFNVNQTEQFSMCCRFMPNGEDEFVKTGYFGGGGGMQLGSHRIITMNLPWIAYEAKKTERDPLEIIRDIVLDAVKVLTTHKVILKKYVDLHFLLFFDIDWMNLDQLYSTVGFHGYPEFLKILGYDSTSQAGRNLGKKVFTAIRSQLAELSKEMSQVAGMKMKFNLEETPAEGSTGTLAKLNNMRFGSKDEFYSNQFVPLYEDVPLHERLQIEGELSAILTGGSMTTINLLDQMDEQNSLKLHRRIVDNTDVSQFSINYGWSVCDCGIVKTGLIEKCTCGRTPHQYTRIVGYFAPVENWNKVRQNELKTRKWYSV